VSDLRTLYQDVIFDHNRHPRNFGKLEGANRIVEGFNPLCGDRLTLYLRVEDGVVRDVRFEGQGCAISTASASLMTESVKGKRLEEAERLFGQVHDMLTGRGEPAELGKLSVLSGVREFPARVKCATLAWHSLHSALEDRHETVTTE
jgi:nitrogen fixation NifU-like protein